MHLHVYYQYICIIFRGSVIKIKRSKLQLISDFSGNAEITGLGIDGPDNDGRILPATV